MAEKNGDQILYLDHTEEELEPRKKKEREYSRYEE